MQRTYNSIPEIDPENSQLKTSNSTAVEKSQISQRVNSFCLILVLACCLYIASLCREVVHLIRNGNIAHLNSNLVHQSISSIERLSSKSSPKPKDTFLTQKPTVLVVYGPADDLWQQVMAESVVRGVESINSTAAILKDIQSVTFQDVLESDAVILGSPVENANTHPALQKWINSWDVRHDFSNKIGAAFVTAGGISAGEELTLMSLLQSLMIFRFIIVGGDSWRSAFGASAITDEEPFVDFHDDTNAYFARVCYQRNDEVVHPMFLTKAFGLGARVADVTTKFIK